MHRMLRTAATVGVMTLAAAPLATQAMAQGRPTGRPAPAPAPAPPAAIAPKASTDTVEGEAAGPPSRWTPIRGTSSGTARRANSPRR